MPGCRVSGRGGAAACGALHELRCTASAASGDGTAVANGVGRLPGEAVSYTHLTLPTNREV
eukprot:14628617-Heterocapsa_arctica.AAC.1